MILTCPDCASRYFVEDERLGDGGRTVRCGSCGGKWTARADAPLELTQPPEIGPFGEADLKLPAEPAPELKDLPPAELPKVFRGRAQTKEKVREAATSGVIWAGLVAGFLLLVGIAVLMRQDISSLWPRAAGAYAMAGLPVNLVGLVIEDQRAQPALKDGHAVLTVSGSLRNVRDRSIAAPPLKISVLNPAGRVLAVKIADPGGALIPTGEARHFAVDIVDPPEGAANVDITFALDQRRTAPPAQPTARAQAAPPLRSITDVPANLPQGPVQNARPLPSDSPYALPAANPTGAHG